MKSGITDLVVYADSKKYEYFMKTMTVLTMQTGHLNRGQLQLHRDIKYNFAHFSIFCLAQQWMAWRNGSSI